MSDCDYCGGELVKDGFEDVYICQWCGQRWYFKKDFDRGSAR